MRIRSINKKKAWFTHRSDCYCNACFRHKCTKKGIKKKEWTMDYFEYIHSELWIKRKELYYKKHPKQCRACGRFDKIHLHHLKYGYWTREKDEDLMPLCEPCHAEFHTIYGTGKYLKHNTHLFIKQKQAYIQSSINMLQLDKIVTEHVNPLDVKL